MKYPTGDDIVTTAQNQVTQTKQRPLWDEIDLSDTENAQIELREIVEYSGAGILQKFILEGLVEIQFDVPELTLLFAYYDVDTLNELVGKQIPVIVDSDGNFRIIACHGSSHASNKHALVFEFDAHFKDNHEEMITGGVE